MSFSGELDHTNIDRVTQYATRYVLCEKPFVLDLGDVDAFADSSITLLYAVDDACYDAGCRVGSRGESSRSRSDAPLRRPGRVPHRGVRA